MSSCEQVEASLLDNVCDDDIFLVVVDEMTSYERLALCLGVTAVQVHEIQNDSPHDYKLVKQRCLELWRDKEGLSATIHALVCAFLKDGNREAAEAIVQYIKQISTSCRPSNPDSVHPEKAVHRYPNWEDMSEEERRTIKETLVVENVEVKRKFTVYLQRISRSFERRGAKLNLAKKSSELVASATSVRDVFVILSSHSSFFNYQLLEDIVEDVGNSEEQQLLSEYKNDILKPYLQRSIFEVPSDSTASSASMQSSTYCFCLKLFERIDLSAHEVFIIKHNLAKLLQLPAPSISLDLTYFDGNSIYLVFSIPKEVYNKCPDTSPLHKYIAQDGSSSSHIITYTADFVLIL